jgi:hypothetical protein
LRDNQNFSADIKKRTVHLALIVSEDAQMDNFISQRLDLNLAIILSYSQQDQEALIYLAHDFSVYGHAGMAYTL